MCCSEIDAQWHTCLSHMKQAAGFPVAGTLKPQSPDLHQGSMPQVAGRYLPPNSFRHGLHRGGIAARLHQPEGACYDRHHPRKHILLLNAFGCACHYATWPAQAVERHDESMQTMLLSVAAHCCSPRQAQLQHVQGPLAAAAAGNSSSGARWRRAAPAAVRLESGAPAQAAAHEHKSQKALLSQMLVTGGQQAGDKVVGRAELPRVAALTVTAQDQRQAPGACCLSSDGHSDGHSPKGYQQNGKLIDLLSVAEAPASPEPPAPLSSCSDAATSVSARPLPPPARPRCALMSSASCSVCRQ